MTERGGGMSGRVEHGGAVEEMGVVGGAEVVVEDGRRVYTWVIRGRDEATTKEGGSVAAGAEVCAAGAGDGGEFSARAEESVDFSAGAEGDGEKMNGGGNVVVWLGSTRTGLEDGEMVVV